MPNYENSSIYKLCCKDVEVKEIYIGSTVNFTRRKHCHKSRCNNENGKYYNYNIYQYIREHGGWDNWDMIEIEKVNCIDRRELCKIEREFIEKYNSKLNKNNPYTTEEEKKEYYKEWYNNNKEYYKENNKEKNKKWRENNKDKIKVYKEDNKEYFKEKNKEWYNNNKEYFKEKNKEWYNNNKEYMKEYVKNNKEHIKEYYKEYRENNKEKLKEKITCSCGYVVTKKNISRHRKSEKHIKSLTV